MVERCHNNNVLFLIFHFLYRVRPIEPPVETADGSEVSKDKFICSVCSKVIPIDYRDIHQKSHKTTNNFNCDICNKKFYSSEYLEMHMSVHNLDKVSLAVSYLNML